jgi:hypothetical protein
MARSAITIERKLLKQLAAASLAHRPSTMDALDYDIKKSSRNMLARRPALV